jgi:hypothetical protein
MSSELSDKMKLKLASFEAEAARAAAAERSVGRTIEPDNTFRDKLKVFKSIETEAANAPPPPATRRDSESSGLPPPLRRDSDTGWLQRAGRADSVGKLAQVALPAESAQTSAPPPAARQPPATSTAAMRRDSEPATPEKLRDFPAPFRSSSSSSALMNTIQNNKFFQQVKILPVPGSMFVFFF